MLKNIRHERFVMEYFANGGNAQAAYMVAYPWVTDKRKATNCAFNLVHCNKKIARRMQELRETMARRTEITVEKILEDYQEALDLAKKQEKPGEIVNAATAQAKLVGLMRERVETGGPGDFENMDDISEILAAVSDEVSPEAALALGKALEATQEADSSFDDIEAPSDSIN